MTERLSWTPKEFSEATGIAYTTIRDHIAAGLIEVSYPSPKRMIITRAAGEAYLAALPTEKRTA